MSESAIKRNFLTMNEDTNYKYIRFAECCFEVSGNGEANIMATLQSAKGAEKAECMVYLQKYDGDWTTIKMWDKECKGGYVTFFNTAKLNKDETYKIQVYFSVSRGAYYERFFAEEIRCVG